MNGNNGILIPDKKLVYFYIPKCACTSLKAFLARHLKLKFIDPHAAPFDYIPPSRVADYHGWTSFALVRHPLDRLVSLYRDKIRPGYRGWGFKAGVEQFVFGKYQGFHEKMSFEQFATMCMDIPPGSSDYHFAPQWGQISHDGEPAVQHLFKMENMEPFLAFLTDRGLNVETLYHSNPTKRMGPWEDRYTSELRERAVEYYRDDMKQFGYD